MPQGIWIGQGLPGRRASTPRARRRTEAIGFALESPDVAAAPQAGLVAERTASGQRPAAAVGRFARTTVAIESIDRRTHTVTFKGQDGLTRAVPVVTPEGREFASRLRAGDRVDVTWEEAVAISVEPGK